jgi:sugar-specific transcriptional regulator TrmB
MTEFLERLKAELADAQERQKNLAIKLNAINAEYQAVSQEVNSYIKIVEVQTRKEQGPDAAPPLSVTIVRRIPPAQTATEETNKTELVREILRSHPSGMTGGELWTAVKDKFPHRQYVYSVLKRLKKKGDVSQKRKKFFFTAKPEEVTQHTVQ